MVSWTDFGLIVDTGDNIRAQIFDPREAAVTLNGTLADDSFFGTIFADSLSGFFGNDTLAGAAGNDRLHGEFGSDTLRGGLGNDRAYGGAGNDVVRGGRGSDVLDGGIGNDTLKGGNGADRFIFTSAAEAGTGASRDRIVDFAAGIDKLDLTAFMAGGQFIGGAAYTPGNGPQVRFATATGILSGDVDGNGTVDFQLKLDGAPVLTAADFLF